MVIVLLNSNGVNNKMQ